MSWLVVATWKFSLPGVVAAAKILQENGKCLDAVEKVARIVESDSSIESVGLGGFPNDVGEVELDAAIMDGRDLSLGAVAGVKNFLHPVSIARRIMDSPHNFLVGKGAEEFARRLGLETGTLLTQERHEQWSALKKRNEKKNTTGHDTIAVIALDAHGDMACATSSSGLKMKHQGRVGDAPLIGSGFYVDNEIGGAVATGMGEDIMKCCPCFQATALLQHGHTPQKVAEMVVSQAHARLSKTADVRNIALLCVDNQGNCGGAANHRDFQYVIASSDEQPRIVEV